MLAPKPHPRRCNRVMSTSEHKHNAAALISMPIGSTFHSPSTPKTEPSPTLHIPSLPARSVTSPQALEQLIQMSERAIDDIIHKFDYSFSGLLEKTQDTKQGFTAPAYLEHVRPSYPGCGLSLQKNIEDDEDRGFCDSGLGSSLASSPCEESPSGFFRSGMSWCCWHW